MLFEEAPFVLLVDETRLARVQAFTAGYEREVPSPFRYLNTGTGSQLTVYRTPPALLANGDLHSLRFGSPGGGSVAVSIRRPRI